MSRHVQLHSSIGASGILTSERADRVRTALRAAAGEPTDALELRVEELEERIVPGFAN